MTFLRVARVIFDPASVVPDPGYHDHHELILILAGTYHGTCERKRFVLNAGEGAIYPSGLRHACRDRRLGAITQLALAWNGGPDLGGLLRFADPAGRVAQPLHRLFDLRGGADAQLAAMRDHLLGVVLQEALWLAAGEPQGGIDDPVERVRRQIEDSFHSPLDLTHLCNWSGLGRSTLCRQFAERFGCGPMHYLAEVRLRHARHLLARGDLASDQVAARVGLRDGVALSRLLKARTGYGLREFRGHLRR